MTQFDIFPNPIPASRHVYPLLVSMQSTLLADRKSQVVAPLVPRRKLSGAAADSRLAPVVKIDDDEYVVLVPALMTLPAVELSRRIANISRYRESLLGAVDLLFYGV
jgi:toxin CcdB